MDIFYVYVYLDPMKIGKFNYGSFQFENEPFYVGKGKKNRMDYHIKSYIKNKYNTHKNNKIKFIKNNNMAPIIIKLFDGISEFDANNKEIELISLIGRNDKRLGPLLNLTDGGEGSSGYIFSDYSRNKISIRVSKNPPMLNKKHTYESIDKIKLARKKQTGVNSPMYGKKHKDSSIEKIRKSRTGKNSSKITRDKISTSLQKSKYYDNYFLPIVRLDLNHVLLEEYESIKDAQMKYKCKYIHYISNACKGKMKTYDGFIWKFKKDFEKCQ